MINDASIRQFHQQLWADAGDEARRYEALHARDPTALAEIMRAAVRCADLKTLVLAGPILLARGQIDRPAMMALGQALLTLGRPAEALEVLRHPDLAPEASRNRFMAVARALAGTRRFEEALAAVADALRAKYNYAPALRLHEALTDLIELQAQPPAVGDWPRLRLAAELELELGLAADARLRLQPLLLGEAGQDGLVPAEVLDAAELALKVSDPAEVRAFLDARRDQALDPERLATLLTACDVLAGRAATAGFGGETGKDLRAWRALDLASRDPDGAVAELAALADAHKHDGGIRSALAGAVGARALASIRPAFRPGRSGKIVNLVMFNDEFSLLRMRLEEEASWVDRFVIVEAAQTFTGLDKPLHFQANAGLFADYASQIVPLPVASFPACVASPWARDFHQRDMAIAAAVDLCSAEDMILITDVDEIVDGEALRGFDGDFAALQMRMSRFFLNYRPAPENKKRMRRTAAVFKAKHLARHGSSFARFVLAREQPQAYVVPDAGWHFNSMTDAHGVARKLGSYAHQEQSKARFRGAEHFQGVLDQIRQGAPEPGWEITGIDDTFPAYVRRNQAALADMIVQPPPSSRQAALAGSR